MLFFMGHIVMKQLIVESPSFQLFVRQTILTAISVHVLFLLVFVYFSIPVLIVSNIGSLLLYIIALWLLRARSLRAIAVLIWIDLIGHALISSEVLGWQSGFHFYLLLLVPMSFLYTLKSQAKRIFLIEAVLVIYLLLDYHFYGRQVMLELPSLYSVLIRYLNLVIFFIGLSYQLYIYQSLREEDVSSIPESATTDQLTGLDNRCAILSKIDEIFASSPYARQPMALIIAEVDHFKSMRERYGQSISDTALIHVAQILHDSIRHNDRASRWGGGEFLLLLPGGSLTSAEQIAKRVQEKLVNVPLKTEGISLPVSLTFSVAELLPDESFDQCLIRADTALQHGKQSGGNRIELASVDFATTSPA